MDQEDVMFVAHQLKEPVVWNIVREMQGQDQDNQLRQVERECDTRKLVRMVLAKLKPRQVFVLKLAFGFGVDGDPGGEELTNEEIGWILGVSAGRVYQIYAKALCHARRYASRSLREACERECS